MTIDPVGIEQDQALGLLIESPTVVAPQKLTSRDEDHIFLHRYRCSCGTWGGFCLAAWLVNLNIAGLEDVKNDPADR